MGNKKRYVGHEGYTKLSQAGNSSLKMLDFGIIELPTKGTLDFATEGMETALIVLSGTCDIAAEGISWASVGSRKSVFEGKASAAYLPRGKRATITARTKVKIAVIQSPVSVDTTPTLVRPEDVKVATLGKPTWMRDTHFIIDDRVPSKRLYIGEAFIYPGNWAGFPPHKHEVDDLPDEAVLEEVYFYLFKPELGFALQMLYSDDRSLNEVHVVESNDLVEFPRGYHPVVNAPGYSCYFLWAMAGENRGFYRRNDPRHDWLSAVENIMSKNGL